MMEWVIFSIRFIPQFFPKLPILICLIFDFRLYDVMCCNGRKLKALLENEFVYSVVTKSPLCSTIGLEFSPKDDDLSESSSSDLAIGMTYLRALLGEDTLAALCNYLAISKRKAALNVSQDKGKTEEVPPGEIHSLANDTTDVPTPALPDHSTLLEIEPTVSKEEPEIIISPTKTIPAERDYPEVSWHTCNNSAMLKTCIDKVQYFDYSFSL